MTNYKELADLEIVRRIANYESKALEELYDRYSTILYSLLKKIAPDEKTAGEILVEVFVIIWRKAEHFDFRTGNVYTWLVSITRNRAIDSMKRNRRGSEQLDNYDDDYENFFILPVIDKNCDALDLETAENVKPKMESALDKLIDAQKYVLHLSYYEGYTLNEIAKKLKIPVETVREKVTTAVHNLRDNLLKQ